MNTILWIWFYLYTQKATWFYFYYLCAHIFNEAHMPLYIPGHEANSLDKKDTSRKFVSSWNFQACNKNKVSYLDRISKYYKTGLKMVLIRPSVHI